MAKSRVHLRGKMENLMSYNSRGIRRLKYNEKLLATLLGTIYVKELADNNI